MNEDLEQSIIAHLLHQRLRHFSKRLPRLQVASRGSLPRSQIRSALDAYHSPKL